MDSPAPTERARRAARLETRAVYRHADQAYAPFSCPASAECCQLAKTGRQPWLWLGEWLVLEERLAREGRRPRARPDGACPLLGDDGRCTVYEDRPFGCRTFFCHRIQGPARQPVEAVNALLERLAKVAQQVDPDSQPRPLLEWLLGEHR
jgi:hypothetical protein